jgi:hypothetical protein
MEEVREVEGQQLYVIELDREVEIEIDDEMME